MPPLIKAVSLAMMINYLGLLLGPSLNGTPSCLYSFKLQIFDVLYDVEKYRKIEKANYKFTNDFIYEYEIIREQKRLKAIIKVSISSEQPVKAHIFLPLVKYIDKCMYEDPGLVIDELPFYKYVASKLANCPVIFRVDWNSRKYAPSKKQNTIFPSFGRNDGRAEPVKTSQ